MKKQVLSLMTVILFGVLAIGSKTQKLGWYTFSSANNVEEPSSQGDYVYTTDGELHYGSKIKMQTGLLVRDLVKMNGEKFKMSDVYGIRSGDRFYIRKGTEFPMRVVRGAINIYQLVKITQETTVDQYGRSKTRQSTSIYNYAEKNSDGNLLPVDKMEQVRNLVAGCPQAMTLAGVSDKEVRKLIKSDREYLNSIFETYNASCGRK